MTLTEEQKKDLEYFNHKFMIINGTRYYVKECEDGFNLKEIIGKRLADLLGLRCASYDVVTINGKMFYLSKDLSELGNARNLTLIGDINNSLYTIWFGLEKNFENSKELMEELIKIYFFDLLFLNSDRKKHNIVIVSSISNTHLYMIDNSLIFSKMRSEIFSSMTRYDELKNVKKIDWLNKDKIHLELNIHNLDYFFNTSSQEFYNTFLEMYKKATPDTVRKVIEEIESEYNYQIPDKEEMLKLYNENYEEIRKLLESRGEKCGTRVH